MLGIASLILLLLISLTWHGVNKVLAVLMLQYGKVDKENRIESEKRPPIDLDIEEDARLTTPELVTKYGYNSEVHYVTTEDGYILELHRISGGPKSPPRKGKKVVFLMHGVLTTSCSYILTGPNHALGYMLADNDFDVWLANSRGNTYSTNHTKLKPYGFFDRRRFWSFSWHEMGVYDLPASIDYVLAETGESKLQYIGHSQGGTAFFVMVSERPEYNDKIEMMHALGPAVFLSHNKSPPIRAVVPFLTILHTLKSIIGIEYFDPGKKVLHLLGKLLRRDKVLTQAICEIYWFLLMGYDSDQMNKAILPLMFVHGHAGSSTNQLIHFGQSVNSGRFRKFDYGFIKNKIEYKQSTPPDYNLKNARAPVALYYSQNDWMSSVEDIHILKEHLPNLVKDYLIPHKRFNHIDFQWGLDAGILLYDEILKTMKSSGTYPENNVDLYKSPADRNKFFLKKVSKKIKKKR